MDNYALGVITGILLMMGLLIWLRPSANEVANEKYMTERKIESEIARQLHFLRERECICQEPYGTPKAPTTRKGRG